MTIPNFEFAPENILTVFIHASNISTWSGFKFKHCLFKDLQYQQPYIYLYLAKTKGIKMLGQLRSSPPREILDGETLGFPNWPQW